MADSKSHHVSTGDMLMISELERRVEGLEGGVVVGPSEPPIIISDSKSHHLSIADMLLVSDISRRVAVLEGS